MEIQKIIEKIKEMKDEFIKLKSIGYEKGRDEYYTKSQFLERIIDRIYPEKDAKQLKTQSRRGIFIACDKTNEEEQADFCYDIDLKLRIIETILTEFELFGFDDFKPVKDKVETEWQVGSEHFGGFFKKKTTK